MKRPALVLLASCMALACAGGSPASEPSIDMAQPAVLVLSRTLGFRHDSIPAAVAAVRKLGAARGWRVTATEDPSTFNDADLAAYEVVIFLCTTGDVLDDAQQAALERFVRSGKGFVGVHSASDTEYDWPWYGALIGAYFERHPTIQAAKVFVEKPEHPAASSLPNPWSRTDEWYAFRSNPRQSVEVLLRLDETSYAPGEASMGADHPVAWSHEYDGGRSFYTALGHTAASYAEPEFLAHLAGGIEWAGKLQRD
ncbi:MAG: ThuA domain-containing protein [Myxococcota bacterium]